MTGTKGDNHDGQGFAEPPPMHVTLEVARGHGATRRGHGVGACRCHPAIAAAAVLVLPDASLRRARCKEGTKARRHLRHTRQLSGMQLRTRARRTSLTKVYSEGGGMDLLGATQKPTAP